MSLIKRENAIEALEKNKSDWCNDYNRPIDKCIFTLITLPSAEAEWILCSERMPCEKDGRVLVTKRGEVMTARYSEFSCTWYVGEMCAVGDEDPIAWMPLPLPYREGGEV